MRASVTQLWRQYDHTQWEHFWIPTSLITKVQTRYCASVFCLPKIRRLLHCLFLQDFLTLTWRRWQAGEQLIPHDATSLGDNWVSPLVSGHFSCSETFTNPCICWITTVAPSQALARGIFPSTHFPAEEKQMSSDMKEAVLWGRECKRRKYVPCWS